MKITIEFSLKGKDLHIIEKLRFTHIQRKDINKMV